MTYFVLLQNVCNGEVVKSDEMIYSFQLNYNNRIIFLNADFVIDISNMQFL